MWPTYRKDSEFIHTCCGPHYHYLIHSYFNQHLPQHWIRCTIAEHQTLLRWPTRSPDLMLCDFFVVGICYELILPPLPELQRWIITAISYINCDMLQQVRVEMDSHRDIHHVAKGEHIEHLWGMNKKLAEFLFPPVCHVLQSFLPYKCTNFMKYVRELKITLYIV